MFLVEATWWAHRALWQLIYAGVMERHPTLQFVFTEQGTAWLPEQLATLDAYADRMSGAAGSQEHVFGADVMSRLSLKPSEYWARQCHVGSSFIRRHEVAAAPRGRRRPHHVGQRLPPPRGLLAVVSHEHLRLAFAGVPVDEVAAMVGGNAARVYGFDLDALAPVAARVGPPVDEVAAPARARRDPRRGAAVPGVRAGCGRPVRSTR